MNNIKSITIQLDRSKLKDIPDSIGVYLFKNKTDSVYIGKSLHLKARLLSHFENATLDPKEAAIIQNSRSIEIVYTDSEFKALLLEAKLIQTQHPKYNRRWQDDKGYLYIQVTVNDRFPKLFPVRRDFPKKELYFGPFPSTSDVHEIIKEIRRVFPFCTQKNISNRPCFYSKLGLCSPCPNEIHKISDKNLQNNMRKKYMRNIRQVIYVLNGNVELVLRRLYTNMKKFSSEGKFEEALIMRNKITRFEHLIYQNQFIGDITYSYNQSEERIKSLLEFLQPYFPNLDSLNRIECYDVSNLFQKEAAASMVVFSQGKQDKSQYRRFKIKNVKLSSDFAMLEEVLLRRFHNSWKVPNLIIVDGGKPQVRKILSVLHVLKKDIPVIGIAKHPDRLIPGLRNIITVKPPIHNLGFTLIRAIRDESHRFAKKYHLLLRRKRMSL